MFVSCFYHNGAPYDDNNGDNIFEDPLFVDTAAGDFSLKLASPCVNPKSGFWAFTDSDGSPRDIGAFARDLSLPIAVRPRFRNATAEHTVSHEPILSWDYLDTAVSNLQAFEIEVGTERDPFVATHWQTGELPAADSLTPYAGVPLEDGQDYIYRVRLRSETQLGDWMYASVHMNVVPDAPTPVTPINDQIVSAASVQLRVDSVFDSDGDFVQYDFDLYHAGLR